MATVTVLLGVLIVVAIALCGVGIWALLEGVKTARSVRKLAGDLDERVVPLLDKVDVTVDAVNAELLRVDGIVTQIEEISDRVENTSRTVQDVANAPVEIVTDIADRLRRAWKTRRAHASDGRATSQSHDDASAQRAATPDFDAEPAQAATDPGGNRSAHDE